MANIVLKYSALSSKVQSINLSRLRATSKATQVLSNLSIKALQQLNTIPILFYKISFTIYSYLDKTLFTRAPILYGFALKTKYKHLLSNSLEKINVYYYGYNKLQAAISKNFLADKYRDG